MTMLALDWDATRVRAVLGEAGDYALPVALDPPNLDLPIAINLEGRAPEVAGASALRHSRHAPDLVCQEYLPHLTDTPGQGRLWQGGRHSLGARSACELVWRKLHSLSANTLGVFLSVPSYLQPGQANALRHLGERAKLPLLGSPPLLTAALAGHVEQFWQRSVLVVDADDHALTLGWVKAVADKAHLVESRSFPQLGGRAWKERLLNVLSDLCVLHHRRDPRDIPLAEQSLFDQLDPVTDAVHRHQAIQLAVQGQQWFRHMLVHPEQTTQFCAPLANRVVQAANEVLLCWPASELPRCILLTQAAGRLPGLAEALETLVLGSSSLETRLPMRDTNYHEEDFGDELMFPATEERGGVLVLSAEAPARAAHALAALIGHGMLSMGHLESMAPLAAPSAVDAGPLRLNVQGRDYLLQGGGVTLGSQFGCQVHFDRNVHPDVAPRHCAIVHDEVGFTLHSLCRDATLVNDQHVAGSIVLHSGDRIRLGLRGPLIRFLGTPRSALVAT